ncbi:homeodomain-interacting protein kinase 1-like isoform X2 [Trachinotus anak]
MGQTCLAFEMLDKNLYDLLQERDWKPLSLNEIRPIAKQLLVALDALKGLGILHTDIKPDNVMFVNNQDQPLRVKLIDFGEAIPASKIQPGLELQPTGYRAPEVALGFPFTEAIDVWGVGCVLAFLYIAQNLFPVDCDYQMMKCMVELLGQPEDHLLRAGLYTQYFFIEEEAADGPTWRVMTPEEYTVANNMKPEEWNSFTELPSSLDDLVNIYAEGEAAEFKDRRAFVDNLKGLLHLDGDQRITPCQALQYSFITMSHLTEHLDSRVYLTTSLIMMEGSADRVHTSAAKSHFRGRPSGSKDDAAATRSFYRTKATSYYKDPASWFTDGVRGTCSYDKDPASWFTDGVPVTSSYYKHPASWFTDGVSVTSSNDEDPTSWSSNGEKPTDSTAAASSSSGHIQKLLERIHRFFSRVSAAFCCWRSAVED